MASLHLVVLIHGLLGNKNDMRSLRDTLEATGKFKTIIIESIRGVLTFDGISVNAWRVYRDLIEQLEGVSKLSIIGYSLGGLISRYLVGILEDSDFWGTTGIQAGFLATFATPHLGSRAWNVDFMSKMFNCGVSTLLGPTGRDLISDGRKGLLVGLADLSGPAMRGLGRFKLYLISNTVNDAAVPFWTSFITDEDSFECPPGVTFCNTPDSTKELTNSGSVEKSPEPRPLNLSLWPLHASFERTPMGYIVLTLFSIPAVPIALLLELCTLCAVVGLTIKGYVVEAWYKTFGRYHNQRAIDRLHTLFSSRRLTAPEVSNDEPTKNGESNVTTSTVAGDPNSPLVQPVTEAYSSKIVALSKVKKAQLRALNTLPWQKYAVRFEKKDAHAEIVNVPGKNGEGKALLEIICSQLPA